MSDVVIVAAIGAASVLGSAWINQRAQARTHIAVQEVKAEVTEVHEEVKTANGLALGQLADLAETRRVEAIPVDERTAAEEEHVEVVPPPAGT